MASKDASLSKERRDAAVVVAKEFRRRAEESGILEKILMVDELLPPYKSRMVAEPQRVKDATKILREVRQNMEDMAKFYAKDMSEKLGKNLSSYLADPSDSRQLIAWNTMKKDLDEVGPASRSMLEVLENLDESPDMKAYITKKKFSKVVAALASARFYEGELVTAYARKVGLYEKVSN